MTPEEQAAAEKAAQEQKAKEEAERLAKEKELQTPQNLEAALGELAKARDALTAANHEAADRRKKLKAFEDQEVKRQEEEKKRRDAELTEVERLKKEKEEKETALSEHQLQLQTERARNAFERVVRKSGKQFANDDAESDALDAFSILLEFDDEGKPKDPEKIFEKLLEKKSYLVKTEAQPRLPNNNARTRTSGKTEDAEARRKELAQRFRIKI